MNGRSPAATSPMSPWTNYAPSSPTNTPLQHLPNNTKSPSVQHDSLITMLEPRRSEVHHFQGRCRWKRDHVLHLDFDPSVVGIASQPLWLHWTDEGGLPSAEPAGRTSTSSIKS